MRRALLWWTTPLWRTWRWMTARQQRDQRLRLQRTAPAPLYPSNCWCAGTAMAEQSKPPWWLSPGTAALSFYQSLTFFKCCFIHKCVNQETFCYLWKWVVMGNVASGFSPVVTHLKSLVFVSLAPSADWSINANLTSPVLLVDKSFLLSHELWTSLVCSCI